MRVLIITQSEPVYITKTIENLLLKILGEHIVVGCIVLSNSPFGKKESVRVKVLKTIKIFGILFFLYYTLRYIRAKLTGLSLPQILKKYNVPLMKLEASVNMPESLAKIGDARPDVILSIAGNEIFKKPLIDLARYGVLNLHTGLLPKYRGLMPTFWALKNKETEVGVSVFLVDEGIDSGPIVVQKKVSVEDRVQSTLIKKTKDVGVNCLIEALGKVSDDTFIPHANNDDDSTYYGFPTRDDVKAFKNSGARFY